MTCCGLGSLELAITGTDLVSAWVVYDPLTTTTTGAESAGNVSEAIKSFSPGRRTSRLCADMGHPRAWLTSRPSGIATEGV
jgi:hypothetical protein